MKNCADCGVTVEKRHEHWGHPRGNGWDMVCRVVDHPTKAGSIVQADYHWVDDGEVQRHFDVCLHCGASRDIESDGTLVWHTDHCDEQSLAVCRAAGHDMRAAVDLA